MKSFCSILCYNFWFVNSKSLFFLTMKEFPPHWGHCRTNIPFLNVWNFSCGAQRARGPGPHHFASGPGPHSQNWARPESPTRCGPYFKSTRICTYIETYIDHRNIFTSQKVSSAVEKTVKTFTQNLSTLLQTAKKTLSKRGDPKTFLKKCITLFEKRFMATAQLTTTQ